MPNDLQNDTKQTWTAQQLEYILILADPGEDRSQQSIAESLNVSRTTLYAWREKEGFWDEVYKLVKDRSNIKYSKVIKALYERAMMGDIPAIRLILDHRGELESKINVSGSLNHTFDIEEARETLLSELASISDSLNKRSDSQQPK